MTAVPANPHPNPALYLSPEMVNELALGMDDMYAIAARHGLSRYEFDQLSDQQWFGQLLVTRRMLLADQGVTFPLKAAMMAEELWQDIFAKHKGGDLQVALALDMAKQLTEIAGMKPKDRMPGAAVGGPAFQININIGEAAPPEPRKAKAPDPKQVIEAKPVVSVAFGDPLPPKPAGFVMPDFKMTPDLVGDRTMHGAVLAAQPA